MKLLNVLFLLTLACVPVQSNDPVKNLRGESAGVGVPEKESDLNKDKEVSEGPTDADAVGVPEKELDATAQKGESVASGDSEGSKDEIDEVGVVLEELDGEAPEAEAEEAEAENDKERSAHRPGRRRPWHGPGRRRPAGGGCRRWVTCRNGWWGGVRCSGGRHCTLWRWASFWAFWSPSGP